MFVKGSDQESQEFFYKSHRQRHLLHRGDTVSISYEEYQNMRARIELLELLAQGEDDVKNGRVAPIKETFDDLRKQLQVR